MTMQVWEWGRMGDESAVDFGVGFEISVEIVASGMR
jgi:hypothetical protein